MLAAAAFLAAGAGAASLVLDDEDPTVTAELITTPTSAATVPVEPPTTAPPPRADVGAQAVSGVERPVRLGVPALGVDAPVISLGLNPDDTLEVPSTARETGWWSGGSVPGMPGPAVIVGHVNLSGEAGVFADLGRLTAGEEVQVHLDAGQTVRYRVDRVERVAKDAFPTEAVYGSTPGPQLRLVTCGGAFDRSTGHYLDNVIVFATALS